MSTRKQQTIRNDIRFKSTGLHTGRKIEMNVLPAPDNTGIVFVRKDTSQEERIRSYFDMVTDTMLATTIGKNGTSVSTIEHLMSAFFGMGIDNAVVEVTGPEVPIMDGSAIAFVNLIKIAGTAIQKSNKKRLLVKSPVIFSDGECFAELRPAKQFEITYSIDFPHPIIGKQTYHLFFSQADYEENIAKARTFGFLHDVEYLQARGLALGGSLQNAIVLDNVKVLNKEGLRFPDEFVRHKILDAIGDLSLLGMPIIGHFIANKSGHRLHNNLLKELVNNKKSWKIVD